jgi:dihydrodipicolinate synthase/N-acetylneuraminate lyase
MFPVIPRRKIHGYSAILLPYTSTAEVDWAAFNAHLQRTAQAGLIPAVNMDTGYAHLLEPATRREVLRQTRQTLGNSPFVAGTVVVDRPGSAFDAAAYQREIEQILTFGGIPVIFQSYGLTSLPPDRLLEAYAGFGRLAERFIAFELGSMFAPFGQIYQLEVFEGLLGIPQCVAAKHSSLSRRLEWQRLQLRDRLRPDFQILTGNDLAIDMVIYGSDYLLGLSTFAPDYFALRDRWWQAGDPRFYELNDVLQYLGWFAFRHPTPAYRHSAAQFLWLRGWIASSQPHPLCPRRPRSDLPILREILHRLEQFKDA